MNKKLNIIGISDPELEPALNEIRRLFPWRFGLGKAVNISFEREEHSAMGGWKLESFGGESLRLSYARTSDALRGLGVLMGQLEEFGAAQAVHEETPFQTLGVMLDVSRNAVLRVETIRTLIRHFSLMGINRIFLYMEDTYEIPDEPLFGYFRGAYSERELKQIDDDAAIFGIEVVPFIQTLGHLRQVLQWPPYADFQDTSDVILTGHLKTAALIEKMLVAATAPFRSRRVHIGMDEAHGIGTGRHRLLHGTASSFEILTKYLEQISSICGRLGLSPMIWSDMFFRIGSKTEDYYDLESVIPDYVVERIPSNMELVYWDYYHVDKEFYKEWIKRHRDLGKEPIFAAGAWTWNRFWAALPRSFATLKAGMQAAREMKLQDAMITLWGDNGGECTPFSALPAVQYFSEMAYAPANAEERISAHFRGTCASDNSSWTVACGIDYYSDLGDQALAVLNTGKWILWHDPVLSFLASDISPTLIGHYEALAAELRGYLERGERRLEFPCRLAEILALKVRLHLDLRPNYQAGNVAVLEQMAKRDVPELIEKIQDLWEFHRTLWHDENKAFGWENLERRYGGLLLRLETLRHKLLRYLEDPASPIEELEKCTHPVYPNGALPHLVIHHQRASSPSMII